LLSGLLVADNSRRWLIVQTVQQRPRTAAVR
jgi:hypothetical protein